MKNFTFASALLTAGLLGLSLLGGPAAASPAAPAPTVEAPRCPAPPPAEAPVLALPDAKPMSCTAQGHDCESKKECCSGMCVKKKGGGKKCA